MKYRSGYQETFNILFIATVFFSTDKRENIKTTAYVGMFKAKILVIGPREVRRKEMLIYNVVLTPKCL